MQLGRAAISIIAAISLLVPVAASAQGSVGAAIAGAVTDSGGGVLPGVGVTAFSPALIERARTVVTDGQGRYRIVDLRPGTYAVEFTLQGFSTTRREGIELTTGFTATVNAQLGVAALKETVTVSAASPLVDVQSVRQQQVLTTRDLTVLPTGSASLGQINQITPGMANNRYGESVGGSEGTMQSNSQYFTEFHGKGNNGSVWVMVDGMRGNNTLSNGGTAYIPNIFHAQEIVSETGGLSAESPTSYGVVNVIPKEGGNRFSGAIGGIFTHDSLQSRALSQEVIDRGGNSPPGIRHLREVHFAVGGPIVRDKLWFFTPHRFIDTENQAPNTFYNLNQGGALYAPDLSRPGYAQDIHRSTAARLTWQASKRNKLNVFVDNQLECACKIASLTNAAPEAFRNDTFNTTMTQGTWTMPVTNRLLLEAGVGNFFINLNQKRQPEVRLTDISILDASRNYTYNAITASPGIGYGPDKIMGRYTQRFSASYVTGSHSFKAGLQMEQMTSDYPVQANQDVSYTFLGTRPSSVTVYATPFEPKNRVRNVGVFVQDQWTVDRLTLSAGLRYDHVYGWVPAQSIPAGPYVGARNFDEVTGVPNWHDLSPRVGLVYDLLGDGQTALKFQFGRYVGPEGGATGFTNANNPMMSTGFSASRTWFDDNSNYVPDCDLTSFTANGECGALLSTIFGRLDPRARQHDPEYLSGWHVRGYLWDVSAEVQHALTDRIGVTVGYYRNWFGNFSVTENTEVNPGQYDSFCLSAPRDPRLPGGGGYELCNLSDVQPQFVAASSQGGSFTTLAKNFGDFTRVSNYFAVNLNARLAGGTRLGGGLDLGETVQDQCFTVDIPRTSISVAS